MSNRIKEVRQFVNLVLRNTDFKQFYLSINYLSYYGCFFFRNGVSVSLEKKSESWEENIAFPYMKLFLSTNSVLLLILKEKHHLSYHVQPLLRIASTIRHRWKWILYKHADIQYLLSVISLCLCKCNCIIRYQKIK